MKPLARLFVAFFLTCSLAGCCCHKWWDPCGTGYPTYGGYPPAQYSGSVVGNSCPPAQCDSCWSGACGPCDTYAESPVIPNDSYATPTYPVVPEAPCHDCGPTYAPNSPPMEEPQATPPPPETTYWPSDSQYLPAGAYYSAPGPVYSDHSHLEPIPSSAMSAPAQPAPWQSSAAHEPVQAPPANVHRHHATGSDPSQHDARQLQWVPRQL